MSEERIKGVETYTDFITLRVILIIFAALCCVVAVNVFNRNKSYSKYRATDALFLSIIITDCLVTIFGATSSMIAIQRMQANIDTIVSLWESLLVALFHTAFIATILWSPILSIFVRSGGNPDFSVKLSWGFALGLGLIYGIFCFLEIESAESSKKIYREFSRAIVLIIYSFSALVVIMTTILVHNAKVMGTYAVQSRIEVQARLLRFLLILLLLQLPYTLVLYHKEWFSIEFCAIAQCFVYAVPIWNAIMYGIRPSCCISSTAASIALNGNKSVTTDTCHTRTDSDQIALVELTGLTDIQFIAQGASGTVFRAHWLGIDVAMKQLKPIGPTFGVDRQLYGTIIQESEQAFIEEAALSARLRHPNILLFIRAGYYQGNICILTEFCARGSLQHVLETTPRLDWGKKLSLALHISQGVTYLHARNPTYIHRDLKSSNILVTDAWHAKVADFGISRVSDIVNRTGLRRKSISPTFAYSTSTSFAGTWRWNAPEILDDPNRCIYSRATDMYSFGMILWQIVTDGAIPFDNYKFDFEVREQVTQGNRPPLFKPDGCPQAFIDLIVDCWSQNPSKRPTAVTASQRLSEIIQNSTFDRESHLNTGSTWRVSTNTSCFTDTGQRRVSSVCSWNSMTGNSDDRRSDSFQRYTTSSEDEARGHSSVDRVRRPSSIAYLPSLQEDEMMLSRTIDMPVEIMLEYGELTSSRVRNSVDEI